MQTNTPWSYRQLSKHQVGNTTSKEVLGNKKFWLARYPFLASNSVYWIVSKCTEIRPFVSIIKCILPQPNTHSAYKHLMEETKRQLQPWGYCNKYGGMLRGKILSLYSVCLLVLAFGPVELNVPCCFLSIHVSITCSTKKTVSHFTVLWVHWLCSVWNMPTSVHISKWFL